MIELTVGTVRTIPDHVVLHASIQDDPDLPDNRAHTDVAGPTGDLESQDTYARIARLVIPVDA